MQRGLSAIAELLVNSRSRPVYQFPFPFLLLLVFISSPVYFSNRIPVPTLSSKLLSAGAMTEPSSPLQYTAEAHHKAKTFILTITHLYRFPYSFLFTHFKCKSIELLTGSGEDYMYC